MSSFITQTSFASGEIDPLLAGRLDIRASQEGCRRLLNIFVQVSGGVIRRPGTRIVRQLLGADRLIGIELATGSAVIALSAGRVEVLENESAYVSLAAPWTAAQVGAVRWGRRSSSLLLAHPDVEPQELARGADGTWTLKPIAFPDLANPAGYPLSRKPFYRFPTADVSIQATYGTQNAADPIAVDKLVLVKTSKPVFTAGHLNTRLRIRGLQVTIMNVTSSNQLVARTDQQLIDGQATFDWQEEAFSAAHGWPVSLAVHQDRLVVGGSRDLPDHVWMSHTSSHFDFDPGTGLDDEGIGFTLTSDRRQQIVAVVPSRQLQVLTTSSEWVVRGLPTTPTSVQAELQTGIGSRPLPYVPPIVVDGATLFIGSTGRELREFLYTDAEQAYQAADLAVLCRHLLDGPVDMAFDAGRRMLCIVRGDGRIVAVTLDRTSNIAAWSLQETAGRFRSVTSVGGMLYVAADFNGKTFLERLDDTLNLDHAIQKTAPSPTVSWAGFDALIGQTVVVASGDGQITTRTLTNGTVVTGQPQTSVTCGVGYSHIVEALPLNVASGGVGLDTLYRPLAITFRVSGTSRILADGGNGLRAIDSSDAQGIADLTLPALGWRRAQDGPPWRIEQGDAASFNLLAVTTELKVSN